MGLEGGGTMAIQVVETPARQTRRGPARMTGRQLDWLLALQRSAPGNRQRSSPERIPQPDAVDSIVLERLL